MLQKLTAKNPSFTILDVHSEAFTAYGRVIDLDTKEIIAAAKTIPMPKEGSVYVPVEEKFAALEVVNTIRDNYFGELPTQVGYCYGHSHLLNAVEWHTSSEINIAVTPLVLFLGHVYDIKDDTIDTAKMQAFYVPAGTALEVYATTLHFCPCEVETSGFGCVVALPADTNTPLSRPAQDPKLFCKNKWILCHTDNETLKARGVKAGVTGENFEVRY